MGNKKKTREVIKKIFHYIILTGIIILFYHLLGIHAVYMTAGRVIWLFLVLVSGDLILHKILGID